MDELHGQNETQTRHVLTFPFDARQNGDALDEGRLNLADFVQFSIINT